MSKSVSYRMYRYICAALFSICLFVYMLPCNVYASEPTTAGFTISNGKLTGYTGGGGAITIPSNVTEIASNAFKGNNTITSVSIPSGVTTIGENAFANCTNLGSINVPGSVTNMGTGVFSGCTALSSVTMQANLSRIPAQTFYGCRSLSSVAISSGVKSIEEQAFSGCNSLTTMAIPDGVTTVGSKAFGYCNSLTGVSIPSSCTSIASDAFLGDQSLSTINVANGNATYASDGGCLYNASYTKLLVIPAGKSSVALNSGTKVIGTGAFSECSGITSLNIPSGCTSIEGGAFNNSSLKTVTIPSSVTEIGSQGAFAPDVIYGYTGSTAETYAADNDFVFYPLDEDRTSGSDEEEVDINVGSGRRVDDDNGGSSGSNGSSGSKGSSGSNGSSGNNSGSSGSSNSGGNSGSGGSSGSGNSGSSGAYASTTGSNHSYDATPKTADTSQIAMAAVALLLVCGCIFLVMGFRKTEEDE